MSADKTQALLALAHTPGLSMYSGKNRSRVTIQVQAGLGASGDMSPTALCGLVSTGYATAMDPPADLEDPEAPYKALFAVTSLLSNLKGEQIFAEVTPEFMALIGTYTDGVKTLGHGQPTQNLSPGVRAIMRLTASYMGGIASAYDKQRRLVANTRTSTYFRRLNPDLELIEQSVWLHRRLDQGSSEQLLQLNGDMARYLMSVKQRGTDALEAPDFAVSTGFPSLLSAIHNASRSLARASGGQTLSTELSRFVDRAINLMPPDLAGTVFAERPRSAIARRLAEHIRRFQPAAPLVQQGTTVNL